MNRALFSTTENSNLLAVRSILHEPWGKVQKTAAITDFFIQHQSFGDVSWGIRTGKEI
ncbi:hypothetical protein LJC71_03400 [Desulfosarcina sp. OttesenSCG-928-A07]|nr:hypothetical protein [Desulfosarcina sp. OttesenSCG-928-G17]MDL2328783.1 hypothetical protein [Desulfosarcina sp. OttesenSCG-928-A07]